MTAAELARLWKRFYDHVAGCRVSWECNDGHALYDEAIQASETELEAERQYANEAVRLSGEFSAGEATHDR